MGRQKLLLAIGGRSLLERALDAAAGRPSVVVVSPALAGAIPQAEDRTIVINAAPERGMTHSLALAVAAIGDPGSAVVVLLADTPYVDRGLVDRVVAALGDADVAYPVRAGVPGHPVAFAPRVRAEIGRLADGDTLRELRDDPRWRRVELAEPGDAPFLDVDTPGDYARTQSGA